MKLPCAKREPIIQTLRDELSANALLIPDSGFQPLVLLESRGKGKAPKVIGDLSSYLVSDNFTFSDDEIEVDEISQISGEETRSIKYQIGLTLLNGFLSGFKGLGVPDLKFSLKSANTFKYKFKNVERKRIDLGKLGKKLKEVQIDPDNPAAARFFVEDAEHPLVVDSIITSNNFIMTMDSDNSSSLEAEIDALVVEVGTAKAGYEAKKTSKSTVSFLGPHSIPFAFSCVELSIDASGKVKNLTSKMMRDVNGNDQEELIQIDLAGEDEWLLS
ncbi:MAG: hypothetical protein AAF824_13485 [Bacteroidota bacterium]